MLIMACVLEWFDPHLFYLYFQFVIDVVEPVVWRYIQRLNNDAHTVITSQLDKHISESMVHNFRRKQKRKKKSERTDFVALCSVFLLSCLSSSSKFSPYGNVDRGMDVFTFLLVMNFDSLCLSVGFHDFWNCTRLCLIFYISFFQIHW